MPAITTAQIQALRTSAAEAGDMAMVAICLPASKPASVALREVRRATAPAPTPDVSKAGDC